MINHFTTSNLWPPLLLSSSVSLLSSKLKRNHSSVRTDVLIKNNKTNQDPEKAPKLQQCFTYASCDKMIKNSPGNVGLSWDIWQEIEINVGCLKSFNHSIFLQTDCSWVTFVTTIEYLLQKSSWHMVKYFPFEEICWNFNSYTKLKFSSQNKNV